VSNDWLRLWHDMPTDPKWRTIARVSGQRIGDVMSVYLFLLVAGSTNATERGRTQSFNSEDVATALDLETDAVESIITAMQGRVLSGDMLRGWAGRQPAREDGAAERSKAWREAQKEAKRTQANESERAPNASERNRTLEKIQSREEEAESKECTTCIADSADADPAVIVPADELATRRKRTAIPCPVQVIADLWDECLPELRSPIVWNDSRRTAVATRWREMAVFNGWTDQAQGVEFFRKTFNAIRGSPFLMGKVQPRDRNQKPFALTLDWMFGPKNFVKVVEGKYHEAR
jgi:hypothetical protein